MNERSKRRLWRFESKQKAGWGPIFILATSEPRTGPHPVPSSILTGGGTSA